MIDAAERCRSKAPAACRVCSKRLLRVESDAALWIRDAGKAGSCLHGHAGNLETRERDSWLCSTSDQAAHAMLQLLSLIEKLHNHRCTR